MSHRCCGLLDVLERPMKRLLMPIAGVLLFVPLFVPFAVNAFSGDGRSAFVAVPVQSSIEGSLFVRPSVAAPHILVGGVAVRLRGETRDADSAPQRTDLSGRF
jgi:hypothetical protein